MRRVAFYRKHHFLRKYQWTIAICLVVVWLLVVIHLYTASEESQYPVSLDRLWLDDSEKHDHWIVVTTINPPSPGLRALATIPGWRVVIVGDLKSPSDWRLPNVVYLDVKKQKKLGYKTVDVLPENSYTRKNIGYLYAIQHGASVIYETDDDNIPNDLLRGFIYNSSFVGLTPRLTLASSSTAVYNPYVHFSTTRLWPRGFPLDLLQKKQTNQHCVSSELSRPAVQQGLVNGDPDVDALYRMIHKPDNGDLDFDFDSDAPPVVLSNELYSPFNSQNTLYHYEAFWMLLLPMTTTFRVCDIWRSYWAQTLMKLVNLKLAFLPPNARQVRNAHSLVKDAAEEIPLYTQASELIQFLKSWNCYENSFYKCVRQLTLLMAEKGFWEEKERELLDAWLTDLNRIGYNPPFLAKQRNHPTTKVCTAEVVYNPVHGISFHSKRKDFFDHSSWDYKGVRQRFIFDKCGQKAKIRKQNVDFSNRYSRTLLIIHVRDDSRIALLESWYRLYFQHIVYCTADVINNNVVTMWGITTIQFSEVTGSRPSSGRLSCLRLAGELFPKMEGFLLLPDHVLMNMKILHTYSLSNIWITGIKSKNDYVFQCTDASTNIDYSNKGTEMEKFRCSTKNFSKMSLSNITFDDAVVYLPYVHYNTLKHLSQNLISGNRNYNFLSNDIFMMSLLCMNQNITFNCLNYHLITRQSFTDLKAFSASYLSITTFDGVFTNNGDFQNYICQRLVIDL